MNELTLLNNLSKNNRSAYQKKQIQAQNRSDRAQEKTVTVLSYDPSSGNYNVQDVAGRTYSARAISNSSAICKGAQVSLVSPMGGGISIIDAMPV